MKLITTALVATFVLAATSCQHIDDKRIPPAAVRIPFNTQGDWDTYGVAGAYSFKEFNKQKRTPQGYPYTELTFTGFGGVLLCSDYNGNPVAYDMACPVECQATVIVSVDNATHLAHCNKCGSEYEICTLNYGYPVAGPAAQKGYGLQVYRVVPGTNGEYRVIIR